MAPPYLQATRMSIDAFMCLTKKERSGMMQTKIRPKTTAKQLQNTKVSRFAVVPDQCQVLEFKSFQQTKDQFANWKKERVWVVQMEAVLSKLHEQANGGLVNEKYPRGTVEEDDRIRINRLVQ